MNIGLFDIRRLSDVTFLHDLSSRPMQRLPSDISARKHGSIGLEVIMVSFSIDLQTPTCSRGTARRHCPCQCLISS